MSLQTVEQIQRLPPYLEGLQKRLLQSLYGTFDGETQTTPGLLDKPIDLPDFKIAGMDPLQQMALSYAPKMFGSYLPYMQGAQAQVGSGLGTLGSAATGVGAGLGQLSDPSQSYKKYMDPYEDDVVRQAERDIDRDYDDRRKKLISGFRRQGQGRGGSGRSAVLEAELAKNRAEQKSRTTSGLRSRGFQDAMGNMLKSSQLLGGLGGTLGQIGGLYNQFAGTTGDLGRLTSELGRRDLGSLMDLGGFGRTYQQQVLDAYKQNKMQGIMEPFTRLQLGSNFLSGMPSSDISSTFKSITTPDANPFLSGVGAYSTLYGAVQPRGTSA
tara:strand:- start:569 stop:1543 length:975 start_codon:yes stop_codon:yes gene_type:complete